MRRPLVNLSFIAAVAGSEHMMAAAGEDPNKPPPVCGYQPAADMGDDGPLLSWGMDLRKANAAECCEACTAKAEEALRQAAEDCRKKDKNCRRERKKSACNSWTFCAEPMCWSPDIHNHTFGECWLRKQHDPFTTPRYNQRGFYSPAMRRVHATAPMRVQWVSGVIGREGDGPAGSCDPGRYTPQGDEPQQADCRDEHKALVEQAKKKAAKKGARAAVEEG